MNKFKIYTDGSFLKDSTTVHGGIVYYDGTTNKPYQRLHVFTDMPHFVSMWNVGGEILAAWVAIRSVAEIVKNNKDANTKYELELVYDYEGVGKWLSGSWKANKPATKWFVNSIRSILHNTPNLSIKYSWVKGHFSIEGNEEADRVASYDMQYCKDNDIIICDVTSLLQEEVRW